MATKAEDLNRHLTACLPIAVQDADGSRWEFDIARVPILTWDPTDTWFSSLRKKTEEFTDRVKQAVEAPSEAVLRQVLLRGVVSPRVSDQPEAGAVCVDDLLRRDVLCLGIYHEIVTYSFERIFHPQKQPKTEEAPVHGGVTARAQG